MNSTLEHQLSNAPEAKNLDTAIAVDGLVKKFGRNTALNGLTMRVPRGSVYALLGRNGAGKSTLIQVLMGMLEPTSGDIRILGLSPVSDAVSLKKVIGYIPDRLPMYDWMTVDELLRFVADFYSNWSPEDERDLVSRFRIARDQKVGALSRGNRALLSLVVAMAHQPSLVLLDECTSGMDAIARREFERSVIEALQAGSRTVLFASHQIDEMERICDWVGIVDEGRMLLEMPIDELKASVKMLRLRAETAPDQLPGCKILARKSTGREHHITVQFDSAQEPRPVLPHGVEYVEEILLNLEEIFVALVGGEGEP